MKKQPHLKTVKRNAIRRSIRFVDLASLLIAAGILVMGLSSCTVVKHPTAGTYASLGGDTQAFKSNAEGFDFASNNNSTAFRDVIKQIRISWQSYLVAEGLKFISGKYYDHQGQIVSADTSVKLEELRNARSLAEGEQALEALKLAPAP